MKLGRLKKYVQEHGLRSSVVLTVDRLFHRPIPEISYSKWLDRNRPSSRDYDRMEKTGWKFNTKFSVIAVMEEKDRTAFIQSVEMQVYRNFRAFKNDPDADYVLVVGGPCILRPDLLWECAAFLDKAGSSKPDLIYFDSDMIGEDGCKEDPSFRPEYDPDLLGCVNYMGSVVLVRHDLLRGTALPVDGEESFHAFLKRICKISQAPQSQIADKPDLPKGPESVRAAHIPMILYHKVFDKRWEDVDRADIRLMQKERPLISVLIPNKDHIEDLDRCVTSLSEDNTWDNLEILIIENNSTRKETFDYYRQLQEKDRRVRVLTWDGPFNYAAINNYGSKSAKGEYILLLNNDTKIIEEDSLASMAALAGMSGVGAVGAMLFYPQGTVQHAGIILGHGGIAGHAWEGEYPDQISGTLQRMIFSSVHNVSAVTGACMMLKRSVFEAAGGFDEALEVTFNDVDLCLRIRRMGLRILQCPEAQLIHYESASRGSEDSQEKVRRFHREIAVFVHRWEKALEKGDPYYNENLTLMGKSWTCKDDIRETAKPYLKYLHMELEEDV